MSILCALDTLVFFLLSAAICYALYGTLFSKNASLGPTKVIS